MDAVPVKPAGNARRLTQYFAALVGNCISNISKSISLSHKLNLFSAMGGALSAGAVFGWSSPAQYPLTNQEEYGFPIDDEQWSWVGSTITLGGK